MKRELTTTTLLVTLTHEKPIKDITDVVANRLSTIEGMDSSGITVGIFKAVQGAGYLLDDVQSRLAGVVHPAETMQHMVDALANSPVGKTFVIKGSSDGVSHEAVSLETVSSSGCGCAPMGDGTDKKCPRADGTLLCEDPVKSFQKEMLNVEGRHHVLYSDKDADRPDVICDSNGQVVLDQCKVCGMAEVELLDTPTCPGPVTTGFLQVDNSIKDDNGQVVLASRDPLDDL